MKTRIVLADDHKIMRDGLRSLLEKLPGVEVVGEAENGRMTVGMVQDKRADLVIMDVGMPDLNGIEATRQIRSIAPKVRVLALSMHSDKRYVSEMFRAGASAYLLKDCAFEELAQAVQVVMTGQAYISPQIAGSIVRDFVSQPTADEGSPYSILTPREREVLQLLSEGKAVKQIAAHLGISIKTVETHRQQLMNKLNVSNLADLIKYAVREGFTSLEP
jgi:two-component system, NarL family, response regulator NreC